MPATRPSPALPTWCVAGSLPSAIPVDPSFSPSLPLCSSFSGSFPATSSSLPCTSPDPAPLARTSTSTSSSRSRSSARCCFDSTGATAPRTVRSRSPWRRGATRSCFTALKRCVPRPAPPRPAPGCAAAAADAVPQMTSLFIHLYRASALSCPAAPCRLRCKLNACSPVCIHDARALYAARGGRGALPCAAGPGLARRVHLVPLCTPPRPPPPAPAPGPACSCSC